MTSTDRPHQAPRLLAAILILLSGAAVLTLFLYIRSYMPATDATSTTDSQRNGTAPRQTPSAEHLGYPGPNGGGGGTTVIMVGDPDRTGEIDPAVRSEPYAPDADFVLGGPAYAVEIVDDVAFVGVGAHLVAYDLRSEGAPLVLSASPPLPGDVRDVVLHGGHAFLAVRQNLWLPSTPGGVYVIDVRDPTAMPVVGRVLLEHRTDRLLVDGDLLIAADTIQFDGIIGPTGTGHASLVDIRQPTSSRLVQRVDLAIVPGAYVASYVFGCDDQGRLVRWSLEEGIVEVAARESSATCLRVVEHEDARRFIVLDDGVGTDPHEPELVVTVYEVSDQGTARPHTAARLLDASARQMDLPPTPIGAGGDAIWVIDEGGDLHALLGGASADRTSVRQPDVELSLHALDVAGNGTHLVVVGASHGAADGTAAQLTTETAYAHGSQVTLLSRQPEGVSLAGMVRGPSKLVTGVAAVGDRAVLVDLDAAGPSRGGHIWLLDLGETYPRVLDVLPDDALESDALDNHIALSHDIAAMGRRSRGEVSRWDVSGGQLEALEPIAAHGPFATYGRLLITSAADGIHIWDQASPATKGPAATLPLESRYGVALDVAGERLWIANREADTVRIMVLDLTRLASPLPLAEHELRTADREGPAAIAALDDGAVLSLGIGDLMGVRFDEATAALSPTWRWQHAQDSWLTFSPRVWTAHGHIWAAVHPGDRRTMHADKGLLRLHPHDPPASAPEPVPLPAAVRAGPTVAYDYLRDSYNGLSLAGLDDRILGTAIDGGFFALRP